MPPRDFGTYQLVSPLGAGGMAQTYLALRKGPDGFEQRVCLKRILPSLETDAEFVRLFEDEAKLSAQLRHANIVQVLDFGQQAGSHFLALELIEGLDLRGLLRALGANGQMLPSGLVSFLGHELADALSYAHGRRSDAQDVIVHRDISPSNVLLSNAGEVKLTDFGIAKAMSEPSFTRTGIVKGKVPYMAPEYATRGQFDARCDLFSLGVLLYESLIGRRPFDGSTDVETIENTRDGRFAPILSLLPTVPPALASAIEKLLQPNPDKRFQTADAFLSALQAVAAPITSRRILGGLVRKYSAPTKGSHPEDEAPSNGGAGADSNLPYEPTELARAAGTVQLNGGATAQPTQPTPAAADAPTRTRPALLQNAAAPPAPTPTALGAASANSSDRVGSRARTTLAIIAALVLILALLGLLTR